MKQWLPASILATKSSEIWQARRDPDTERANQVEAECVRRGPRRSTRLLWRSMVCSSYFRPMQLA